MTPAQDRLMLEGMRLILRWFWTRHAYWTPKPEDIAEAKRIEGEIGEALDPPLPSP